MGKTVPVLTSYTIFGHDHTSVRNRLNEVVPLRFKPLCVELATSASAAAAQWARRAAGRHPDRVIAAVNIGL